MLDGEHDKKVWWRAFPTTQALIDYANKMVFRKLSCEERQRFFLSLPKECTTLSQTPETSNSKERIKMSQATSFNSVLKQLELLSITEQMELIALVAQQLKNQLPFNKPTKTQELLEKKHNWRKQMTNQPTLQVSSMQIIEPIEEIWEEYV